MSTPGQKVAVITGASQGIGAALVDAYRKLGYAVIANSRNITASADPAVVAVQGDIADPATASRVVEAGLDPRHPTGHRAHAGAGRRSRRPGHDQPGRPRHLQRDLEDAAFVTGEILHVDGGQSAGH